MRSMTSGDRAQTMPSVFAEKTYLPAPATAIRVYCVG